MRFKFNHFIVRLASCLIVSSFLSFAFATCTKTQVEHANTQWANAIASHNVNKVVNLYASQAVLLATVENKPIITQQGRTQYFTHFFDTYKNAHVKYKGKQYIQVFADGAVSSGLYNFYGKKQGKDVVVPAPYTFCLFVNQRRLSIDYPSFLDVTELKRLVYYRKIFDNGA